MHCIDIVLNLLYLNQGQSKVSQILLTICYFYYWESNVSILLWQFQFIIIKWYDIRLLLKASPCAWYGQSMHNMRSASLFLNNLVWSEMSFVHRPNFCTSFPAAEVLCVDQGMIENDSGKSSLTFYYFEVTIYTYTDTIFYKQLTNNFLSSQSSPIAQSFRTSKNQDFNSIDTSPQ